MKKNNAIGESSHSYQIFFNSYLCCSDTIKEKHGTCIFSAEILPFVPHEHECKYGQGTFSVHHLHLFWTGHALKHLIPNEVQ